MRANVESVSILLALSLMTCVGACDDDSSRDELVVGEDADDGGLQPAVAQLTTEPTEPPSAGEFCERLSAAYLGASAGCDPEQVGAETIECPLTLDHPLLASGEITFDPHGAVTYIEAAKAEAAACTGALPVEPLFLQGSRGEGEDCTPIAGDLTYAKSCAAGLRCLADAQGQGTCQQPLGELLAQTPDCADGRCQPMHGARTDLSNPDELCVYANANDNSGTTGTISLRWLYYGDKDSCSITGIDDGQLKCCTPSDTGSSGSLAFQMRVGLSSSDGLRVGYVGVRKNGTLYYLDDFNNLDLNLYLQCTGCDFFSNDCSTCWVDNDGHGDCDDAAFEFSSGDAWCVIF